jgi:hypothetical protein
MKSMVGLVAVALVASCLAGCGGGNAVRTVDPAVVGEWDANCYIQDGVTYPCAHSDGWDIAADGTFTHRGGTSSDYSGTLYTSGTNIMVTVTWAVDAGQMGEWGPMPYQIASRQLRISWDDTNNKPLTSVYDPVP